MKKKHKYVVEVVVGLERRSKVFSDCDQALDYYDSCRIPGTEVVLIQINNGNAFSEVKRKHYE